MLDPDQIDALIHEEVKDQRKLEQDARLSAEFHANRANELAEKLLCEHVPEVDGANYDRCRLCGFRWVRR